ncbi:Protein kinase domain containing protein [Planoprotostelium fungivorum]|uniref:non-specific serine/threonine protein kinase n=1 Tax=Planoprotostelium fungivorum TaxID=1890364 RepID=A0A2P6NKJ0_9EUKA|nr:Protein kinase domain containing protein [Planoprotostelium fungivorum]
MAQAQLSDYKVVGALGRGTFGSVYKIQRKSDGKIMVWKELKYENMKDKEKQQLVQEVNLLQKLRHPNIEYCEGGDLSTLIRSCRRERSEVSEETIWKILMQISLALFECHHKEDGVVLHRDIKPGNVFLDSEQNIKLGDFGLARVLGVDSFANTFVGTPYYMSPEQVVGEPYNEKCDIWALGCLVYELATLHPPFEAVTQPSLMRKIREGKYNGLGENYSEYLQKIIEKMIVVDPKKRWTIQQILDYPPLALRVRERKLALNYNLLKKKEEDLRRKESELQARECEVKLREASLNEREETARSARVLSRQPSFRENYVKEGWTSNKENWSKGNNEL